MKSKVVELLIEKNLIISTAESCTGGKIASGIVDVSGASKVFGVGFVTYSNEAKMKYLKVSKETLDKYTAVSRKTAEEMAVGCKNESNADISVVTTGIAGPASDTDIEPVGTVYIGIAYKDMVKVERFVFEGNRDEVRNKAVKKAFELVYEVLKG